MSTPSTASPSSKSFRLIFHIGAGKTGTSSIQASLRQARDELQTMGFDYWGLMLEFAPVKLFDWQLASASKVFLDLQPQVAREQVQTVLSRSVEAARAKGIHTAVWSNEWFFGRHVNVIPALKALEASDVAVEIVAYVRRHDAWARSAYIQWGLKHKTYDGPLQPFKQYIRKRPVRFAGALQPWADAFPSSFMLRNFDVAGDVVTDFVGALNLPGVVVSTRVNETPGGEELLLRALFNQTIKGEALPVEFDRRLQTQTVDFTLKPREWLSTLLPSPEDLREVVQETSVDREATNRMLKASGQALLSTEIKSQKDLALDVEVLSAALIQILFRQSQKIQRLQRQLNELAAATGNESLLK